MTLEQALDQFDQQQPNPYTRAEKLRWLSRLDGRVTTQILCARRPLPEPFAGYDETTPGDTVLRIPTPYDELYGLYLALQVDRLSGELTRYNNDAQLFNSGYASFQNYWHRTMDPPEPQELCL